MNIQGLADGSREEKPLHMWPFRIKKIDVDLVPFQEALADRNKGVNIPVNPDASNAASRNEEETR